MRPGRRFWLLLHRWAGLLMALPLVIAALSGSLLAFYPELERALNPRLFAEPRASARFDMGTLGALVEQRVPQARVKGVYLAGVGDATYALVEPGIDAATGKRYTLDFNQVFLDPYSGAELARREMGAFTAGSANLMAFIYKLHYTLALHDTGLLVLGIIGVLWTLDCFVGAYLTFPAWRKRRDHSIQASRRGWWRRWSTAWSVKWHAGGTRINFDLHRAGGLWLWAMLLIFAWSSVYMNLWDSVYAKVTRAFFEYHALWTDVPLLDKPMAQPRIGWVEAGQIGSRLMRDQARRHGFTIEEPVYLRLYRDRGVYAYRVRSDRDVQDRRGRTDVLFDADTGELRLFSLPTGQHGGNTLTNWLYALHMGNIFGLPYRIFVCLFGLAVAAFCITGVVIWARKRRTSRARLRRRHPSSSQRVFISAQGR